MPRLRMKVTSRQTRMAGRLMIPPSALVGRSEVSAAGSSIADAGEEGVEVPGDADGHHRDDRDVLQQQVPADEPADDLAQGHVARRCRRSRRAGSCRRTRHRRARRPPRPARRSGRRSGRRVRHRGCRRSPCATSPAREKMPTPMMPPTPIAVSCHKPRLLVSSPVLVLLLDEVDRLAPQHGLGISHFHERSCLGRAPFGAGDVLMPEAAGGRDGRLTLLGGGLLREASEMS